MAVLSAPARLDAMDLDVYTHEADTVSYNDLPVMMLNLGFGGLLIGTVLVMAWAIKRARDLCRR